MTSPRLKPQATLDVNNGKRKLVEADVRKIKAMLAENMTPKEIAPSFGVSPSTISNIKNRKIWRHV